MESTALVFVRSSVWILRGRRGVSSFWNPARIVSLFLYRNRRKETQWRVKLLPHPPHQLHRGSPWEIPHPHLRKRQLTHQQPRLPGWLLSRNPRLDPNVQRRNRRQVRRPLVLGRSRQCGRQPRKSPLFRSLPRRARPLPPQRPQHRRPRCQSQFQQWSLLQPRGSRSCAANAHVRRRAPVRSPSVVAALPN